jgi:hypothetical protein
MKLAIATMSILVALIPASALAMPKFAALENKECIYCHVDPAGGGARNFRGKYYEAHGFSFEGFDEAAAAAAEGGGAGSSVEALMKALSFSGQLRVVRSVAEGPHVPFSSNCDSCHRPGQRAPDNTFFLMQGELAVTARVADNVAFTYSNDLGITRDVYATVNFGGGSTYIKAGVFEVPYGLDEMRDHNALVKSRHNLGSNVRDVGVMGAIQKPRWFASAAVLNGRERFPESAPVLSSFDQDATPAAVLRGGISTPRARAGASFLHDNSGTGNEPRETVGGVFGTLSGDRWRLLAEGDVGEERIGEFDRMNYGILAQASYRVFENTELSARYDRYDQDVDVDMDGESWYSFIVDQTISKHASLQGRARIRDEEWEDVGLDGTGPIPGNDDAMLMLYVHF